MQEIALGQGQIIADLGKLIVENCPPMLCTGLDCAVVTERNGCQVIKEKPLFFNF